MIKNRLEQLAEQSLPLNSDTSQQLLYQSPSLKNDNNTLNLDSNSLAFYKVDDSHISESKLKVQACTETVNFLKVNVWCAYPNFGIGYLMSNGVFG